MAINYFQLFALQPSFVIDETALHRAYVRLQQQFHPDRLVGKSDNERAIAIQQSMDANDGYEILRNQLTRAQHLLELNGLKVNKDGSDAVRPEQTLLMEMMQMREQMEDATDEASVSAIIKDIGDAMSACNNKLEQLFEAKDWDSAAQSTIRLRYLGKALEEAYAKQYQLKDHAS